MVGDLLVRPASRCQHGRGELGCGEVVCHFVARGGVVYASPSSRKTVGDVDDALEVFWPLWLDDRFQHAAQKPVVLAKSLDEIVRTREFPCGKKMIARLFHALQAHVVHHGDEVQVDGGNGVGRGLLRSDAFLRCHAVHACPSVSPFPFDPRSILL